MNEQSIVAPEIVLPETANILRRLERLARSRSQNVPEAFASLKGLEIELFSFAPFADRVWELRHNLTCYDAWYVALAEGLACPLITLDRRLSRATGPTCEFLTPTSPP
jgi:predicted nucleic acid-binding protein